MSGVNWMRWNVPETAPVSVFSDSVLARPGTASSRGGGAPGGRRAARPVKRASEETEGEAAALVVLGIGISCSVGYEQKMRAPRYGHLAATFHSCNGRAKATASRFRERGSGNED